MLSSDRVAAPAAARAAQLAAILDAVTDGVTVQDMQGRLVYANNAAAHILGVPNGAALLAAPTAEILNRYEILDEFRRPMSPARLPGRLVLNGATEAAATICYRLRATGAEYWTLLTARAAGGPGPERLAINTFRDVTDLKRTEGLLRFLTDASRQLSASLDYESTLGTVARLAVPTIADSAVVDLYEDAAITRVVIAAADPAQEALLNKLQRGYAPDPRDLGVAEVLQSGEARLVTNLPLEELLARAKDPEHAQLLAANGTQSYIIVPFLARGRVLGSLALALAESGRHYAPSDLPLVEELARQAALAIDNARLYRDAHEAIATRDQFLSIASHELKTPLTSILAALQLVERRLSRQGAMHPRDSRALELAMAQGRRLNNMVMALLDLSRIESGRLGLNRAPVDLSALARRLVDESQPLLDHHRLVLQGASVPLMIDGDELRLEQVLQNLIGNAVKYSPAGGTVTIRVQRHDDDACVEVADQGVGIPTDALPHLFERFFRAANAEGSGISGMGIGLYVVKEIVTLHGGQIWADSVEGAGTTFTVCLPLVDGSAAT